MYKAGKIKSTEKERGCVACTGCHIYKLDYISPAVCAGGAIPPAMITIVLA